MEVSTLVAVVNPTDVAEARRQGTALATSLGFDETTAGRVALTVTEMATNLLKHAGGGDVFLGPVGNGDHRGVQVIAIDRGDGIHDIEASIRDGVSTAGTPGNGLGAIRRLSTTFDVHTGPGGTVLASTIHARPLPVPHLGGIVVPLPGETQSGDAWASWSAGELTSIFVADGLGHGAEAARAARVAVQIFQQQAERSSREVLTRVHEGLRSTRGAAVALAELDHRTQTLRFCGLGNVSARIVDVNGGERNLASMSGIAGHIMRRLQEFTSPWPAGSLLVMHTDGLSSHWSLDRYPALATRRPDVIAGVLYRDHRRGRDDVTVVVARNSGGGS